MIKKMIASLQIRQDTNRIEQNQDRIKTLD